MGWVGNAIRFQCLNKRTCICKILERQLCLIFHCGEIKKTTLEMKEHVAQRSIACMRRCRVD